MSRSSRGAARLALCHVALLAIASCAVAASPESKKSAHAAHHAHKARLKEEIAAAELATRMKYEVKVTSLEKTTEALRREAEETVASLSAERDALSRNLTKYKRGLLNLDAKRRMETETLRLETERLKAETVELQTKLEEALDAALRATKAAADARRESRAIAKAVAEEKPEFSLETKRRIDEILREGCFMEEAQNRISGTVEKGVRTLKSAFMFPWNAVVRSVRAFAVFVLERGYAPFKEKASEDDVFVFVFAVSFASAFGAFAAKGHLAAEWISRKRVSMRRVVSGKRTSRRSVSPSPPSPSSWLTNDAFDASRPGDSTEFEWIAAAADDARSGGTVKHSPTRAAVDSPLARSFDASPEAFEKEADFERRVRGEAEREDVSGSGGNRAVEASRSMGVSNRVAASEAATAKDAEMKQTPSSVSKSAPRVDDTRDVARTRDTPTDDSKERRSEHSDRARSFVSRLDDESVDGDSGSPGETLSPVIRDGALKSALKKLAEALATPETASPSFRSYHHAKRLHFGDSSVARGTPKEASPKAPNAALSGVPVASDDAAGARSAETKSGLRTRREPFRDGDDFSECVERKPSPKRASAVFVRTATPAFAGGSGRAPGSGDSASSARLETNRRDWE